MTDHVGEMRIIEEPKKVLSMHPKKFAMWLFMASVLMLFASITSAYIVRQAEGNWLFFELPALFAYSTAVIVISSLTIQLGYFAAKHDQFDKLQRMVSVTGVMGVVFLIMQVIGWSQLVSQSIYFVGNPSGSFVYVITGLHGAHIISALIFLLVVLRSASAQRINSGNMAQMEMCVTYWHFLGILWVYLYGFLVLYR